MYIIETIDDVKKITGFGWKDPITWQCKKYGRIHTETEFRNLSRRKNLCDCENLQKCLDEMERRLNQVNFTLVEKNPLKYLSTAFNKISRKKMIKVQCLLCGSISEGYYENYIHGHKKCNCQKAFTTNLTVDEFIEKWPKRTQKNFELLDDKYEGRNHKYNIKCKRCGKTDIRWGITLIDSEIKCKYCEDSSIGEAFISSVLDDLKIPYQREYQIKYNNSFYRFDIYIPSKNCCIEYNGQQHYMSIDYFGGEEKLHRQQYNDDVKIKYCEENNIELLIFSYKDSYKSIEKVLREKFND